MNLHDVLREAKKAGLGFLLLGGGLALLVGAFVGIYEFSHPATAAMPNALVWWGRGCFYAAAVALVLLLSWAVGDCVTPPKEETVEERERRIRRNWHD